LRPHRTHLRSTVLEQRRRRPRRARRRDNPNPARRRGLPCPAAIELLQGSRFGSRSGLARQQLALPFNAPPVSRKLAVIPHDSMTGNGNGNPVRCASLCNCARGMRCANLPGDLGVTGGGAERDAAQRLPDTLLERRSANVQWEAQADPRRFNEPADLRDELLELAVPTDQVRLRKLVLQLTRQYIGIVA